MAKPKDNLRDVITRHNRVAVVGGPVTGKSVLTDYAHSVGKTVFHSDDFQFTHQGVPWSEQSERLRDAVIGRDRFVVAGIVADRAVRKGLEVDAIVLSEDSRKGLSKGQRTLKKQIEKRARQIADDKGIPLYIHTQGDEE